MVFMLHVLAQCALFALSAFLAFLWYCCAFACAMDPELAALVAAECIKESRNEAFAKRILTLLEYVFRLPFVHEGCHVLCRRRGLEITHVAHVRGDWGDFTLPRSPEVAGSLLNFMIAFWKKHAPAELPIADGVAKTVSSGHTCLVCIAFVCVCGCQDRCSEASTGLDGHFLQGLERFFASKGQKKFVEFDMMEAMTEAGLVMLFHVDVWPASTAVRELATQLKTKRFAYSELKK